MEQEELRLIEALQKTQLQQKAAYSELEEALNTSKAVFVSKSREFVQAVSSSPTNLLGASRSFSRQSLDRLQNHCVLRHMSVPLVLENHESNSCGDNAGT